MPFAATCPVFTLSRSIAPRSLPVAPRAGLALCYWRCSRRASRRPCWSLASSSASEHRAELEHQRPLLVLTLEVTLVFGVGLGVGWRDDVHDELAAHHDHLVAIVQTGQEALPGQAHGAEHDVVVEV